MSNDIPARAFLTTYQAAHALGISEAQLTYMMRNGEASPTYRMPGDKGAYLWTRAEVQRILDTSDMNRRAFRRRRKKLDYPLNGLVPVVPRPRRRRLPAPPP